MKNVVYRAINKTLTGILIVGVLANGALAVYQTHVFHRASFSYTLQVSFGQEPPKTFAVAEAINEKQLLPPQVANNPIPTPGRKPEVPTNGGK